MTFEVKSMPIPVEHYCEDCLPPGRLESTEYRCVRIEE